MAGCCLCSAVIDTCAIPIVGIALTHFLVDLWWFSALDYGTYFWLRLLYRYLLSGAVAVIFFLIFFLNFLVASRYLGVEEEVACRTEFSSKYRRLLHLFQTVSLIVYTPLSLILAIVIALPFYREWEAALLFLFGPDAGIRDPVYNNDVDFYLFSYLFSYPFYHLIQSELLITLTDPHPVYGAALLGRASLYSAAEEGMATWREDPPDRPVRSNCFASGVGPHVGALRSVIRRQP
jgi:uncharacterized membrane protein (UPF0182 family)